MNRTEIYNWVFKVFPVWLRYQWLKLRVRLGFKPMKFKPSLLYGEPAYYYYRNGKKRGIGAVVGYDSIAGWKIALEKGIDEKVLRTKRLYCLHRPTKKEYMISDARYHINSHR